MASRGIDTGIVTPEAVVLDFETAGFGSRALSGLLDLGAQGLAIVGLAYALVPAGELFGGTAGAAATLGVFGVLFGYPVASEVLWRGRTLGKAALGLRVVTVEGGPIQFRHAAIRAMLSLVDKFVLFGAPGLLMILATRRNQRLGDLVAGTLVLRERQAGPRPQAVRFTPPPGLEAFARSLDVSRLDHEGYGAVRSFLLRATTLDPPVRWRLAGELAVLVVTKLGMAAPSMPPEAFLVCVAAAFQDAAARQPHAAPAFSSVWAGAGSPRSSPAAPPAGPPETGSAAVAGGYVAPG